MENTRVGQRTDYDKLTLEVDTDGSIAPKEALKEAAHILIRHFSLFSDESIDEVEQEEVEADELFDDEARQTRALLKSKLADLGLSVRALNCLRAADVETLADLVKHDKEELLTFRNFGKKSLTEIEELLEKNNLTLGMDLSKYKLDRE